jgi:nucleoid-associated protein YgaU
LDPDRLGRPIRWLRTTETEAAVAALARLAGLVGVTWVLGSSLLYALGRMLGWKRPRLQWLSIGPVRRAVDTLVAGSLVVSTMAPAVALVDPGTIPPPTAGPVEFVDPAYVPTPAGSADIPASTGPIDPPAASTDPPPAPTGTATPDPTEVTVRSGDSMWILATRHLEAIRGHSPTEGEVGPYWIRMVEANRHHIRSGDPDLIFPGEVLKLPPLDG